MRNSGSAEIHCFTVIVGGKAYNGTYDAWIVVRIVCNRRGESCDIAVSVPDASSLSVIMTSPPIRDTASQIFMLSVATITSPTPDSTALLYV